MNTITCCGTLVDAFQLETSPKGVDFVRFALDDAKHSTDKVTKQRKTRVQRFDVVARDHLARNLAGSALRAGDRLIVAGSVLQSRRRAPTGQPVETVELAATDAAPSLRYAAVDNIHPNTRAKASSTARTRARTRAQ